MSRLVSKAEVNRMLKSHKSNHSDEWNYLNLLLYNCALRGIVKPELLNEDELNSLVMILEGKHKDFFYDERMKQIRYRKRLRDERK